MSDEETFVKAMLWAFENERATLKKESDLKDAHDALHESVRGICKNCGECMDINDLRFCRVASKPFLRSCVNCSHTLFEIEYSRTPSE